MLNLLRALYKIWANSAVQSLTSIIGTIAILWLTYRTSLFAWPFIRPSKFRKFRHSDSGSWALVTGSSDGIGRAFAEELAFRGYDVLLHGRNEEKLNRIRSGVSRRYPDRSFEIVVADASKCDDSYNLILQKVRSLPGKLTVRVL